MTSNSTRTTFTTKELSTRTWGDFEKLFSQPGTGWSACWCMLCQRGRHLPRSEFSTKAKQGKQNRREKKQLVDQRRAHGILVYSGGEPIGWCQFGPIQELPLSEKAPDAANPSWRVTCFVTDKRFRRQGVASVALRAALAAIKKRGGGLVEGYPLAVEKPWPYTGTVELFEKEGFVEARRYLLHSDEFPRYDKNRVANGNWVVVMRRTV